MHFLTRYFKSLIIFLDVEFYRKLAQVVFHNEKSAQQMLCGLFFEFPKVNQNLEFELGKTLTAASICLTEKYNCLENLT